MTKETIIQSSNGDILAALKNNQKLAKKELRNKKFAKIIAIFYKLFSFKQIRSAFIFYFIYTESINHKTLESKTKINGIYKNIKKAKTRYMSIVSFRPSLNIYLNEAEKMESKYLISTKNKNGERERFEFKTTLIKKNIWGIFKMMFKK